MLFVFFSQKWWVVGKKKPLDQLNEYNSRSEHAVKEEGQNVN